MKVPGVEYRSPRPFTLQQRLTLAVAPRVCAWGIAAIGHTLRDDVRGAERFQSAIDSCGHVIIAFWHETIPMAIWRYRNTGYHTMTSFSYDGELAARAVRALGCLAVRGSTSSGGGGALRELEKAMTQVEGIGITPDGPKGPRRVAQAGAAILAARTQTPIVPHAVVAKPDWRLNSWDRFMIPKPFSTVVHAYGHPISPPPDDSPESVESVRKQMESDLNTLHAEVERELDVSVFEGE